MRDNKGRLPISWWFLITLVLIILAGQFRMQLQILELSEKLVIPEPTRYTVPEEWEI